MSFFTLLSTIFFSTISLYLSLTNSLAISISPLFSFGERDEFSSVMSEPLLNVKAFDQSGRTDSMSAISNILLYDRAFQQASLISSFAIDETVLSDTESDMQTTITKSLVNLFCQYITKESIRTTTGSGFFINSKGIILTNAHVAQYLLLKDADLTDAHITCVIRTGSPATPAYTVDLLYLPPRWIFENATQILDETPLGTGEDDYALLYVTGTQNGSDLPIFFPSIAPSTEDITLSLVGTTVFTGGYPAQALITEGSHVALSPTVATTTIDDLFTFGSNYADLMQISHFPATEQGVSGGPIVTRYGEAIGLIVTKNESDTGYANSLNALTFSYINRTMRSETGYSLIENIRGNVEYRARVYKNALIPVLSNLLKFEITTHQ